MAAIRGAGLTKERGGRRDAGKSSRPRSSRRAAPKIKKGGPMLETVPAEVGGPLAAFGGLSELSRAMPDPAVAREAARVFSAVSDPVRLRILCALAESPLCPCILRVIEPMADSALSYHLRILKQSGLLVSRARSNFRIYEASPLGRRILAFARRDQALGRWLRRPLR